MAQFARPIQDISRGSWTTSSGATADLWAAIDEADADDNDYIRSELNTNDAYEVQLSPVDAALISRLHILNYRARKSAVAGNTRGVTVELLQGATVIASRSHDDLTILWATVPLLLTKEQGASITDYADLRVRFTATGTTGGRQNQRRAVWVSWCQFRVPDAEEFIDDRIAAWGVVIDTSVPGTVTASLDGFTGSGPRLVDALVDLWEKLRMVEEWNVDPVRERRWRLSYYLRKHIDYFDLRARVVSGDHPLPPDQSQEYALGRIDQKLGNFVAISRSADAEEGF